MKRTLTEAERRAIERICAYGARRTIEDDDEPFEEWYEGEEE